MEVFCYVLHCCLDTNSSTIVELRRGGLKNFPAITQSPSVLVCYSGNWDLLVKNELQQ